MGFRNNNIGYPEGLLASRAIVKKGVYALIPLDGLIRNEIPGFKDCDLTILASPKMGATFVDYLLTMNKGGKTTEGFGGDGVETLVYCISGKISASADDEKFELTEGGYLFCPPSKKMHLENTSGEVAELFLYKRRYKPAKGYSEPPVVSNHVKNLEPIKYEGMENVIFYNFLPAPENLSFDMNFHVLEFGPGASHGYIETHVQEHGAFIYSGTGMYNLDNKWMPVQKGDYIFMGAYTHQAAYSTSKDVPFGYVYSKDCNRDEDV